MTKLVIIHSEGVLRFAGSAEQDWLPVPGSLEGLAQLSQAGWRIVLISQQPGFNQGTLSLVAFSDLQHKMHRAVAAVNARIDAFFFCPHAPDQDCACRMPKPGLLIDIGQRFQVALEQVPMVGSTVSEMEAARAAGCAAHWVQEKPILGTSKNWHWHRSFADFVEFITHSL